MNTLEWVGKMGTYEWVIDNINFRNKIDAWIQRLSDGSLTDQQIPVVKKYIGELIQGETEFINLVTEFKGRGNQILKLKYIDGLTLEVISVTLKVDDSVIAKKHAKIT